MTLFISCLIGWLGGYFLYPIINKKSKEIKPIEIIHMEPTIRQIKKIKVKEQKVAGDMYMMVDAFTGDIYYNDRTIYRFLSHSETYEVEVFGDTIVKIIRQIV